MSTCTRALTFQNLRQNSLFPDAGREAAGAHLVHGGGDGGGAAAGLAGEVKTSVAFCQV
jgi:hypothetical protein